MTTEPESTTRILMVTMHDHRDPRGGGPLRTRAVATALTESVGETDVVWRWPTAGHDPVTSSPAPGRFPGSDLLRCVTAFLQVLVAAARTRSFTVLRTVSWRMVRAIVALRREHTYRLSVLEYSTMAAYRPILPEPVVIDLHNIESALARNYLASISAQRGLSGWTRRLRTRCDIAGLERVERHLGECFAAASVVSTHDAETLTEIAHAQPIRVVTAPNGVSARCLRGDWDREPTVVFVALLSWRPNIDAARWLAHEVWPHVRAARPAARLQIVGARPAREVRELGGLPGVSVHGDVRDPLEHVGPAAVATAPLLAAGGTRLKILEALGAGTPVVATTMGALGLERLQGPHLTIVDDPTGFARALVDAVDRRCQVSRASVRELASEYLWTVTLRELVDVCRELTTGRRPSQQS